MDTVLCDELLQEIFCRLSPPCSAAVSLVSRRWLHLLRCSTTFLTLHFPPPYNPTTLDSLSSFLSNHPFLSSLSLSLSTTITSPSIAAGDQILLSIASSCPKLHHLRFLSTPVLPLSLSTLSSSCVYLNSLAIGLARPVSFHWLVFFKCLKHLSVVVTGPPAQVELNDDDHDVELSLETLALSKIRSVDYGIGFLWKNCRKIKKLQLKSCESLGDYGSFTRFLKGSKGLQEVELKTSRSVVDGVLLKLAENSVSLDSLLVYDGGSKEGLLQFIRHGNCNVRKLDLRLPLDLDNTHLIAMSENLSFRGLVSLRLQSCCLVTGEGLKALGRAVSNGLEELVLVNCDVVERESGLLTTLGQDLKGLRRLDLSYNEMLFDKEFVSMLVSCNSLAELRVRGCGRLTNLAMVSIVQSCKKLQCVDIMHCSGIEAAGVEVLVLNSPRLRRVHVEQSKLSDFARTWTSDKFIEVVA